MSTQTQNGTQTHDGTAEVNSFAVVRESSRWRLQVRSRTNRDSNGELAEQATKPTEPKKPDGDGGDKSHEKPRTGIVLLIGFWHIVLMAVTLWVILASWHTVESLWAADTAARAVKDAADTAAQAVKDAADTAAQAAPESASKTAADKATEALTTTKLGWLTLSATSGVLLMGVLGGVAGSLVQTSVIFTSRLGRGTFEESYTWWYLLRPFVAALLGMIFVAALGSGLLTLISQNSSGTASLAAGAVAGLSTDSVMQRLRSVLGATSTEKKGSEQPETGAAKPDTTNTSDEQSSDKAGTGKDKKS